MKLGKYAVLLILAIVHFAALAGVLVSGLTIWSTAHLTLRNLGPDTAVFISLFVVIGVPVFYLVTKYANRLLCSETRLTSHLYSSWVLYIVGLFALVFIVRNPIQISAEGGDIAIRVVFLLAIFGIVVSAIFGKNRHADT